jgi:D-alanyl-D-alanine carboxypeptidase (penicillin-binding protein 5/6)
MTQPARRIAAAFVAGFLSLTTAALAAGAPARAMAQSPATQPKYAAIVVDANSGEVLYASRADSPRYPASITKVMSLYMAFEALEQGKVKLTDRVVISPRAAAQAPTKLGLRPGETIGVDEAMHVIAIRSYNDIAVALAEHLGGSESRFAALMTLRAQELGMTQTRFVNANGLPDSRQISSARDIALLKPGGAARLPTVLQLLQHAPLQLPRPRHAQHQRPAAHHAGRGRDQDRLHQCVGLQPGRPPRVRDGRRLIAIVMGGASTSVAQQPCAGAAERRVRRWSAARPGRDGAAGQLLPVNYGTRYAAVGSSAQGDYSPVQPKERSTARTYASLTSSLGYEPEVQGHDHRAADAGQAAGARQDSRREARPAG